MKCTVRPECLAVQASGLTTLLDDRWLNDNNLDGAVPEEMKAYLCLMGAVQGRPA